MVLENFQLAVPEKLFATAESLHVSGCYQLDQIDTSTDIYRLSSPLTWEIDVTNTGGALLVSGEARACVVASCGRCLEDAQYELVGSVEGFFLIPGDDGQSFDHDEEEEFEVLSSDNVIDLEPLVMGSLYLGMPMVPLCSEDCQGLCPQCGANLNQGDCHCSEEEEGKVKLGANNPFGALAGLTFD